MAALMVADEDHLHEVGQREERDVDQLAYELGTLAATLAAATCRFLLLLAEFDRREAWEAQGVSSTSHWLSWRCGMSSTTAREQVRVARRLVDLPLTVAQFAAGRLSYSKVRALTRVATAGTEVELLTIAASATANQLDRFVAGVATAISVKDVNDRHNARYLSFRTEADGSVTFSGCCAPEDGALILERLRLVQDYLARTGAATASHTADSTPIAHEVREVTRGRALIDALVLLCAEANVGSEEESVSADEAIGSRRSETVLHVTLDELSKATRAGYVQAASVEGAGSEPPRREQLEGEPPRCAEVDASVKVPRAGGEDASAVGPRDGTEGASAEVPSAPQRVRIGARLEMGPGLHPATARRLCCDTGLVLSIHHGGIYDGGVEPRPTRRGVRRGCGCGTLGTAGRQVVSGAGVPDVLAEGKPHSRTRDMGRCRALSAAGRARKEA